MIKFKMHIFFKNYKNETFKILVWINLEFFDYFKSDLAKQISQYLTNIPTCTGILITITNYN